MPPLCAKATSTSFMRLDKKCVLQSTHLFMPDTVFHTPGLNHRGLRVLQFPGNGRILFLFFHKIPSGHSMRRKGKKSYTAVKKTQRCNR